MPRRKKYHVFHEDLIGPGQRCINCQEPYSDRAATESCPGKGPTYRETRELLATVLKPWNDLSDEERARFLHEDLKQCYGRR